MYKSYLCIVTLFVSLCSFNMASQDVKILPLTISQMGELIEQNNAEVKVARTNRAVVLQEKKIAQSAKLPELTVSLNLAYNGNATIIDRDFSDAATAPTPHWGNTLNINLYQPIYTGGAISGAIDLAESKRVMSDINYGGILDASKITAISCYLNLFKSRNLIKVYDENIRLTERVLDDMIIKNRQGVVLKNDITRYELRLSTLKYDRKTIQNSIDVLNHDLCSLLGIEQCLIIPDSSIISMPLPFDGMDFWMSLAVANATSIKQIDAQKKIIVDKDKITRSERLPKIGLIAGNTLNGPITYEIPPIDKNINYWWVGLNLSYNLSSLYKTNKKTRLNKIELNELGNRKDALLEDLERTVVKTYTDYVQANDMLVTQQKNVELANENYDIVDKRYNNQLALLTDMLDASNAKLDAEIRLINAKINTIFYYYQLKFISGTL